ncbi:MAG: dihydroorotase, partial [Hymenobacteraceae bacterium]|nr:dihydroorotase [Hymenobacteraceae bacterium]
MNLLLVSAHLHDPGGPHHGQRCHVRVRDGVIAEIMAGEAPAARADERRLTAPDLHVSAGWLDLQCTIGEPGHEARETFATAARAAARGGSTDVLLLSDAAPVTQTRAAVAYVRQRGAETPVRFHAVAAATVDAAGADLTEMHDLRAAGVVAFSDGPNHPLQRAEVLVRALQYATPLGVVLFNRAEHRGLSEGGQINEGPVSVRLGLRGLPALAEDLQLARDLRLLEHAGGRLHVQSLSTAGAVALVRAAKARGL